MIIKTQENNSKHLHLLIHPHPHHYSHFLRLDLTNVERKETAVTGRIFLLVVWQDNALTYTLRYTFSKIL